MNLVALFEEALEFQNFNGTVLSNGKVKVYYIGRTSLADIYNDVAGEYPSENPKILDNLGMGPIYVNPAFDYEIVVYDEYDNELFSVKKYLHSNGAHSTANVEVVPSENIQVSAWTQGDVQVYMPYITGNLGKVYSGIEPIVVNNDEDKISANHVALGLQEPLYFVEDSESACIIGCSAQSEIPSAISGKWEEASNVVIENSAQWGIPEGTMNESAFTYDASSNITAYNGSAFKAGDEFPESATEAINVVTANSAKWNSAYLPKGAFNYMRPYTLAQGLANSAFDYSLAQGGYNIAGGHSLAQGEFNSAEDHSLVQGIWNSARNSSIAQGDHTRANNHSQAFGQGTIATNRGMAIGQYNLTEDAAFVIGNGSGANTARSDAFVIDHSGNVSSQGDISASGISLTSFYTDYQTNSANFVTALPEDLVYTGDLNDYAKKDFVLSGINSATSGLLPTSSFSSVSGSFITALPSDLISSQSGTIFVSGYEIEGTNSAIATATVQGFVTSLNNETIGPNRTASFSWWKSVPNTIFTFTANWPNRDTIVAYSANTNLTGEIIAPRNTATKLDIAVPNATALNVWADDWFMMVDCVAYASDSVGMTVGELAWASALPTYQYDSSNKISAINGSALAGDSGNYIPYTATEDSLTAFITNSGLLIRRTLLGGLNSTYIGDNVQVHYVNGGPQNLKGTVLSYNKLKFESNSDSAYVDKEKIHKWDSASNYIQNSSATINEVNTSYQTNSGNFLTGVDLTPYQTTAGMTAYQPAGDYLTTGDSANFYTTANESGFISEVPAGTMNESAFGYDANDKISGYNGSAFAGGVDETVLWSGDTFSQGNGNRLSATVQLSEPISAFEEIKIISSGNLDSETIILDTSNMSVNGAFTWIVPEGTNSIWIGLRGVFTDQTHLKVYGGYSTTLASVFTSNGWWNYKNIYKVVGINRKA